MRKNIINLIMEPSNFYPAHITDMIQALDRSEVADDILLSYHPRTISDPLLEQVYQTLGFPCTVQIPSKQVKALIENDYMSDFPPIDKDFIKDCEIFNLEYSDLTADLAKEDLFESRSVSSFQSEDTKSTPLNYSPKNMRMPRSKNGLKALSWKVKDIVERLGSSTYQEVADCLVREEVDLKAEKNIRRRVYDALNVLIAVGVLKKYSKTVEPIRKLHVNTHEKVKNLKKLAGKFLRLKAVIERNKESKRNHQNLFVPFNLVAVPKEGVEPAKITMNLHKNNATIRLDQNFVVKDYDEVLKHLNLEFNESWVPREIFLLCKFSNNNSQMF